MKKVNFIIPVILFLWAASFAYAHMLWLNVSNYHPNCGETVWIEIGWGHKYPRDEIIKEEWLEEIYVLNPKGKKLSIEKIFPSFYKFTPKTEGIYQIIAKIKPGFVSKTTEGYKLGSKKELTNVISCFHFVKNAKAIIEVGNKKEGFSLKTNEPLEIIVLKDPTSLKRGDTLPLKIVFQGKPLSGIKVQATYTGYQKTKQKRNWAVEEKTNMQGIVHINLNSKGQWMFTVSHKTPYPDKTVADEYLYTTSLTLGI